MIKLSNLKQTLLLSVAAAAIAVGGASAQSLSDVQPASAPLVLGAHGSFFVGGEAVRETSVQLSGPFGALGSEGTVTNNQMYVQFMAPETATGAPVVMVHGATLSGKEFETTPDGRMGWDEYFVRQGHTVYLADQVGRARSGTDIGAYNDVRVGVAHPDSLANAFRLSDETGWTLFRFGPKPGEAFSGEQFPVAHADQLSKQSIPDFFAALADPNPNYQALSSLADEAGGVVLMGHSQAGAYPLEAALRGDNVRGAILVEPGQCTSPAYTDETYARLARTPILVVFGDNLGGETGVAGFTWQAAFDDCQVLIQRVNAAGGNAQMLYPPELGIRGNSHMIMQDMNNLQIADLILDWVNRNVPNKAEVPMTVTP